MIPESSVTVSDNMKLTWSFIETKFDWWMSFQTVWVCWVRWSKLSKHFELFELMLYSTVTTNEDGWPSYEKHSSVKGHTSPHMQPLTLSTHNALCQTQNIHSPIQVNVRKSSFEAIMQHCIGVHIKHAHIQRTVKASRFPQSQRKALFIDILGEENKTS